MRDASYPLDHTGPLSVCLFVVFDVVFDVVVVVLVVVVGGCCG